MVIRRLDHFNIAPRDLAASRRFYVEVIGLVDGYRPPFDSSGAWLYCGDQAVLHLLCSDQRRDGPTGRLDHIAFLGRGFGETVARLRALGQTFEYRPAPRAGLHQLFIKDPDGVEVEIGFPWEESVPNDLKTSN